MNRKAGENGFYIDLNIMLHYIKEIANIKYGRMKIMPFQYPVILSLNKNKITYTKTLYVQVMLIYQRIMFTAALMNWQDVVTRSILPNGANRHSKNEYHFNLVWRLR